MRIPYSMLRFPARSQQTWGIHFTRSIPRLGEQAEWPYIPPVERTNLVARFGHLTGLNNVNPEVLEAGKVDGAKGWTMLWNIVLPQLRPATFIAVVVTVIGALRSFDLVAVMTAGGPFGSSSVLAYYMYEQALFNYRMGYGAAIATVLFLIMDVYIAFFLTRMLRQEKGGD